MKRRPTAADGSKLERRKETRFPVSIPVEVGWKGAEGQPMKEQGLARQVNAHGGLLEMTNYPDLGTRVTVTNLLSAESNEARVLATPNSREGVAHGIVVELARERQREGEEESADLGLVGERIRRTINFCLEVIADFDAGRITEDTKGVAELLESVEQISQRFRGL